MSVTNKVRLEFLSKSANEGFARTAVAAFAAQLDPTLEELADIKTAVSEGVTNAIVHGYGRPDGIVSVTCELLADRTLRIIISDSGCGIKDINLARQPLYSGSPDCERAGMGFTVMETFMDSMLVESTPGIGTTVILTKRIAEEFAVNREAQNGFVKGN